jgi:hypothetical protein
VTRLSRPARWAVAVQVVLAGALAVTPVAGAAGKAPPPPAAPGVSNTGGVWPPRPGPTGNILNGVVVRSPCDAWAVGLAMTTPDEGNKGPPRTLIAHWDGGRWTQTPSPSPGDQAELTAVAATSATNAWAVGSFEPPNGGSQTLIEHWDGTSWTQVASPSPGDGDELTAVAATSATNAWAVGRFFSAEGVSQTLIEHWDGVSWTQIASPSPGTLTGVLGIGWAVGWQFVSPATVQPVIEHWDGRKWSVVPSADLGPGGTGTLAAVAATSPTNIWAVGSSPSGGTGSDNQMLIEHYDGTSWTLSARPGHGNLLGVAVTGAGDAWAVGDTANPGSAGLPLIEHYDGTTWAPVPVHPFIPFVILAAVSASSPANVLAVGTIPAAVHRFDSLALHARCC